MRWLLGLLATVFVLAIIGAGAVLYGFYHFGRGLPDYDYLVDYEPPVVTRVHAGAGRLLAEFARNERVFVPIEALPKRLVKALLAAADTNFYEQPAVDFVSLLSAVVITVRNSGTAQRPARASTEE